jgi:hypothetical protein
MRKYHRFRRCVRFDSLRLVSFDERMTFIQRVRSEVGIRRLALSALLLSAFSVSESLARFRDDGAGLDGSEKETMNAYLAHLPRGRGVIACRTIQN